MPSYSHSVAVQTADENTSLRARIQRMEKEREDAAKSEGSHLDTAGVDDLKSRNTAIQKEVADLERELQESRLVNVTELSHEYQRLESRRAYLYNENAGLRNIIAHQSREVKRATREVNAQQEIRRANDDYNATAKSDIRMFKERRDNSLKEISQLSSRETQLRTELRGDGNRHNLETEAKRLARENDEKDREIRELEDELRELEMPNDEPDEAGEDITRLREEYVELKSKLTEKKLVSQSL